MRCIVVSHTHWDREWYRSYQGFRARLVDTIDCVLDLVATDPEFRFLLDGQAIALEDYLEVRPGRRGELEEACRAGRISVGPWYVQPDSLLPGGEAHVRNLLEARRVCRPFGGASTVAYTPDSFGHPAQFPQLFAGFGLGPFVYWRGNGSEIDRLPAEYRWRAPDGSEVLVHHLGEGYFGAAGLPGDPMAAALFLEELARKLGERTRGDTVLLMNGIDHAAPQPGVGRALEALRRLSGWPVERGVLEDFAEHLSAEDAPVHEGELVGGRLANLLPGVWSTRMSLKLRNRAAETALRYWAEPFAALAPSFGLPDERPSVRQAWRQLLQNQAHDSICGCSQDRVHEQMEARYDAALELANETAGRVMERLAGRSMARPTPWGEEQWIGVFNPSPRPRTDRVSIELEPSVWLEFNGEHERQMNIHPMLSMGMRSPGFLVDGQPVRAFHGGEGRRVQLEEGAPPRTIEFVAEDVPAFGWRRYRLTQAEAQPDEVDDQSTISEGDVRVTVEPMGTLSVAFGDRVFAGLLGVEDRGDRGDSYDFDPVPGEETVEVAEVRVSRIRHATGISRLIIERTLMLPASLDGERAGRVAARVPVSLRTTVTLVRGTRRVDLDVRLDNGVPDHRLRLLFPSGGPAREYLADTTFDRARRFTGKVDDRDWVHVAPNTVPIQGGFVVNDLAVAAPGLPELEVTPDGVAAVTLIRSIGWLSRMHLDSRPIPAGPLIPVAGAQCLGPLEARLSIGRGDDSPVSDGELELRGVIGGDEPMAEAGVSFIEVVSDGVELSAVKPAEESPGLVLRLSNFTDVARSAVVRLRLELTGVTALRLDETPTEEFSAELVDGELRLVVPPHGQRTVLLHRSESTVRRRVDG